MMQFVSNKGGGEAVGFETVVLDGYAPDGGLYVPQFLPKVSGDQLERWKSLSFKELAFKIVSLFIDRNIVSAEELKLIIEKAYDTFEKDEVIPIRKLKSKNDTYIMELFHGSTLSFKDVGLSFLVNLVDFFLKRKQKKLSVIVATTGDTGPAAASYVAGKSTLDIWVLYPKGMITEEQERQMTTLQQNNVNPVGVYNCKDGADDLDFVIAKLYANGDFKNKVNLSSVNSINWGRVMIQTVHYFYGYFQVADKIGDPISMVVPAGAFGNLCAGGLARKMGLPVKNLIIANNKNSCLHRIFSEGVFSKAPINQTVSSAIDILIPLNFWRYLYFCVNENAQKIKQWVEEFEKNGTVRFDEATFIAYKKGYLSCSVTDQKTLEMIKEVFEEEGYLMDPHTAVSLVAANTLEEKIQGQKIVCFATAHPAKFPIIIQQALSCESLPKAATHPSIEKGKHQCQKGYTADHSHLEDALMHAMENHWDQNGKIRTR